MPLTELPFDILDSISPYLSAKDFVSLSSTCKHLHQSLHDDSGFWRHRTIADFRVNNRPVIENDSTLWRNMYQRLLTQTSIYMWGRGTAEGNPEVKYNYKTATGDKGFGVVSDLQCGGWSTVFLNHLGHLYLEGQIDGEWLKHTDNNRSFERLKFPNGTRERSTVIKRFSVGRQHLLALADDGTLWLWFSARLASVQIQSLNGQVNRATRLVLGSAVTKVVAGWTYSSAYIRDIGIAVWPYKSPIQRWNADLANPDWEYNDYYIVPLSDFITPKKKKHANDSTRAEEEELKELPGEVISYVMLDSWVVFCTDQRRTFAHALNSYHSFELTELEGVIDVQGTFQNLAFFAEDGKVITSNTEYLEACHHNHRLISMTQVELQRLLAIERNQIPTDNLLHRIPALQNSGVLQIAFGDYHFHALHANGRITSYGRDPQGCGALGLVKSNRPLTIRGLVQHRNDWNCTLYGYQTGRAVWLDQSQIEWVKTMDQALDHIPNARPNQIGELSEWVEQQISDTWEDADIESENMYFGLSIAAGGWRGGAIVLLPEGEAVVPQITGMPNIRLSDGTLLISEKQEEVEWKKPLPQAFSEIVGLL